MTIDNPALPQKKSVSSYSRCRYPVACARAVRLHARLSEMGECFNALAYFRAETLGGLRTFITFPQEVEKYSISNLIFSCREMHDTTTPGLAFSERACYVRIRLCHYPYLSARRGLSLCLFVFAGSAT